MALWNSTLGDTLHKLLNTFNKIKNRQNKVMRILTLFPYGSAPLHPSHPELNSYIWLQFLFQ